MRQYEFFMAEIWIGGRSFEAHHSIPSYEDIMGGNGIFLVFRYSPIYNPRKPISDYW